MIEDIARGAQSRTIDLPGGRFHYMVWGEEQIDRPVVVLLHGITSSALSWVRVAPALSDHYQVYALDMRGHGESIKSAPGSYGLRQTADDVQSFIDALPGARSLPPVLLGHSWGGATALILATGDGATRPAPLFSKVILEDPACQMGGNDPEAHAASFTSDIGKSDDQLRAELIAHNPAWSAQDVAAKLYSNNHVSRDAVYSVFRENARMANLIPLLAHLPASSLVVRADPALGSTFTDAEWRRALTLLPSGSRGVQIPGASHNIHRNKFAEFMSVINEFLDQPLS